ncbi:MAG: BrnT family toxin [Janthinobacterium lividum]
MRIDEFLWNWDVVDKLAFKHGIETWEVEEVLDSDPFIRFREKGRRDGEHLYSALGQTGAGRYLIVFFIYKPPSTEYPFSEAFIVSARDMERKERKEYERHQN